MEGDHSFPERIRSFIRSGRAYALETVTVEEVRELAPFLAGVSYDDRRGIDIYFDSSRWCFKDSQHWDRLCPAPKRAFGLRILPADVYVPIPDTFEIALHACKFHIVPAENSGITPEEFAAISL